MKPGTGAFLAFWLHVVAAEVQHIGNIGKEVCNILRGDPVRRFVGVVVVTVPGQGVGNLKVCGVPIVVFVPGADHVCGKGQLRGEFIRDFDFIGIQAVGCVTNAFCRVYDDWCVSAMVITPFLVFLVQPIIQGRACNEPPLSHTAIWNGSAPQQPHQGGYADSQVSRRFLEIEYGLMRTRFHIFHSLLLYLAVLSHIIEP